MPGISASGSFGGGSSTGGSGGSFFGTLLGKAEKAGKNLLLEGVEEAEELAVEEVEKLAGKKPPADTRENRQAQARQQNGDKDFFNKIAGAFGRGSSEGALNNKLFSLGAVDVSVRQGAILIISLLVATIITNLQG